MPTAKSVPVFLDSNIWLYAFISKTDFAAKRRVAQYLISLHDILMTPQIINEVAFNLMRRGNASEDQACWLTQSMFQKYQVVHFTPEIALTASAVRRHYSISYWDSQIIAAGLRADATVLYSEDMQHGLKLESLRIENPFQVQP